MARAIRLAAIGFDVDGTILDSSDGYLSIVNIMYLQFGLTPLTFEELRRSGWRHIPRFFRARGIDERTVSDQELYEMYGQIEAGFDMPHLVKDALRVLEELSRRGFILFVVSRRPQNKILRSLDAYEKITHLFSSVWGGYHDKTEALLEAKKLYGEFAYVGDLALDMIQAKKAGGLAIVSTWGLDHPELLASSPYDFWLESLGEILFLPIKSFKEE